MKRHVEVWEHWKIANGAMEEQFRKYSQQEMMDLSEKIGSIYLQVTTLNWYDNQEQD